MAIPAIGNIGVFSGAEFDPLMQDRELKLRRAQLAQEAGTSRQSFMNAMAARQIEAQKLAEDKRQFDATLNEARASRQAQGEIAGAQNKALLAAKKKPANPRDAWVKLGLPNLSEKLKAEGDAADTYDRDIAFVNEKMQYVKDADAAYADAVRRYNEANQRGDKEAAAKAQNDMQNAAQARAVTQRQIDEVRFRYGNKEVKDWKPNTTINVKLAREIVRHGGAELPIKLRERRLDTLHDRSARLLEQAALRFQIPPGADANERASFTQKRNEWLAEQTEAINKQIDQLEEEIASLAELDNEYFQGFAKTYDEGGQEG